MWSPTRSIGNIGEDVATRYLQQNDFDILERNYLKKWGEIDIIAKKDNTIRFIEVKSQKLGHIESYDKVSWETAPLVVLLENEDIEEFMPEENVTYNKQKRLSRAIRTYLVERRLKDDQEYQIDIMAILLDLRDKKAMIRYTEDVVLV